MKKILGFIVLGLILNGCATSSGGYSGSGNLKAENNLEDWLSSKEYRFAVYMSKCKIEQLDGQYRNCNIFNNLRYKILVDNFELGKNFKEFK